MHDHLLRLAALSVSGYVAGVAARVAQHASGNDWQTPMSSEQSFRERSIFRPSNDVVGAAGAAPPEFHMYDNFGKDTPMPGIATFAHLNWTNCFAPESDHTFDVGITGMPFDLGVSYRPGQRFGPAAARTVSQRMAPFISYRYSKPLPLGTSQCQY